MSRNSANSLKMPRYLVWLGSLDTWFDKSHLDVATKLLYVFFNIETRQDNIQDETVVSSPTDC